ncbi:MAG: EAL domain-containing protein [Eubacteriales bacterium]|nr:EAL domain-containing protein [Eubacteriales bacterium]
MMKLLLDYCNATEAILIAEGIETAQELECLHSLGVHYGQGFFLGKPERAFGNIGDEAAEILERLNGKENMLSLDAQSF